MMDPGVAREAVEGEIGAELRPVGRGLAPRKIRAAPENGIDVHARQPGCFGFLTKAIQRGARGIDRAEVLQE